MKLSIEEVQKLKSEIEECKDKDRCNAFNTNRTMMCGAAYRCVTSMKFIETIEAQQQEIEQLREQLKYAEGAMEIEAFDARQLRHDVQLLEAQVAIMREGLEIAKGYIKFGHKRVLETILNALCTDAGKDYHNPADVEALKQAKETLRQLYYKPEGYNDAFAWPSKEKAEEALAAIEKAIGGNEDGC